MHHPRLTIAAAALGLLASSIPALAAQGDVTGIALRDFDRDGRLDRAVVTVANPSKSAWNVASAHGFSARYLGADVTVLEVFIASDATADPILVEVVLDDQDADLRVDTSAAALEIAHDGLGGVNGSGASLAAIAFGDVGPSDVEIDEAGPQLVAASPGAGTLDALRSAPITLTFSEPVVASSLAFRSAQNVSVSVVSTGITSSIELGHSLYLNRATEAFEVTAGRDEAGNALVTGAYPNPFTFTVAADNTPITRTVPVLLLTQPKEIASVAGNAATPIGWHSTIPSVTQVRLSYLPNEGISYLPIATVPAGHATYVWYPPALSGPLRLKLEGLDANGGAVAVDQRTSLFGAPSVAAPKALTTPTAAIEADGSYALTALLDGAPQSAQAVCDGGSAVAAVAPGRPTRLTASVTSLSAATIATCRFRYVDASGASFETAAVGVAPGPDAQAPSIVGIPTVTGFDVATGTATLTWVTDEPTWGQADYGKLLDYGSNVKSTLLSLTHAMTLTGLTPGALHQARITAFDAAGNHVVSKDVRFVFLREGDLVKGPGPAVYWHKGGKRYAFPNETVYKSWFMGFSGVLSVTESQLASITLGGNVRMQSGVHLIKIQSDPKTYAVEPDGRLRWIPTETQARALYGAAWAARVRDVDVSLFVDYAIGAPLVGDERPGGYVAP